MLSRRPTCAFGLTVAAVIASSSSSPPLLPSPPLPRVRLRFRSHSLHSTMHRVKSSTGGSQEDSVNAEALLKMKKIQGRLSGIYDRDVEAGTYRRSKRGRQISRSSAQARDSQLALSIQGQVHRLIEEASSNKNLHRMYIGWQPWM